MIGMRHDLFSRNWATDNISIHMFEKCDACGALWLLNQITFSGTRFLCFKCLRS